MFNEFKKLLKHSMIYGAGTLISKAVGFLMIPVYTRYLSPKDYGIIEILTLTSFVISWIISMGLSSSVLRFYFDYDTEKERKQVISTGLIALLVGTLLSLAILIHFSKDFALILFKTKEFEFYFKLIFITTFFELSLGIPLTYLRAKEKSIWFTIVSLVQLISGFSFNIYLIVFLKLGILGVFYSSLITNSFICIVMLIITFKEIGFSFSIDKFRKLFNYGIPFIPIGLANFVLSFSDRYFLKSFCSLDIVGLYSLGYKFAMVLGILITVPFQQVWNVSMFTIVQKDNAKQIYSRVLTYFEFIIIFVGLSISMLSKEMIKILASPAFFEASKIIPLLTLGFIFGEANNIFLVGIYLKKKIKYLTYIVISASLLSLILNWILIPKYNMFGAGMVKILYCLYLSCCTLFVSNRLYFIPYEFSRVFKMLFLALFLYLISLLINTNLIIYTILFKMLLLFSFPVLLYLLKFFYKEEVLKGREIFKKISYHVISFCYWKNIYKKLHIK